MKRFHTSERYQYAASIYQYAAWIDVAGIDVTQPAIACVTLWPLFMHAGHCLAIVIIGRKIARTGFSSYN
jgi:hypothetical protein